MSDESSGTTESDAETFEPSMEDILTSIRRIIADDETDKVAEPEFIKDVSTPKVISATSATGEDSAHDSVLSDEDIDLIVDDLVIPDQNTTIDTEAVDILEAPDTPSPILSDLSPESLEEEKHGRSALNMAGVNSIEEADVEKQMVSDDGLINIDNALDSFSEEPDANQEFVIDPALDLLDDQEISEKTDETEMLVDENLTNEVLTDLDDISSFDTMESESDMDIVKALMADLTDDSFLEEIEAGEDNETHSEAEANDFEAVDAEALEDVLELEEEVEIVDDESDVLDDILNLALEDEEALQAEENLELTQLEEETLGTDEPDLETAGKAALGAGALLSIAKMAEADAEQAESEIAQDTQEIDIESDAQQQELESLLEDDAIDDESYLDNEIEGELLSLDELVDEESAEIEAQLAELTSDIEEDLDENSTTNSIEPYIQAPQSEASEEKETMPRAKKSDAILDEVEKTASADVFATLNKAVEEKAIQNERGDRIGDLVMDALRPMLKEWLDENLKGIVERAVTKEVKRISSGK